MPLPSSRGVGATEASALIPRPPSLRGITSMSEFALPRSPPSSEGIDGVAGEACSLTAPSPIRVAPHWGSSPMRALSKLGGGKSSATGAALENLKQQHAEELAIMNEEHARQMVALENEVERCRAEIDALRVLSDEHLDTLMPLPSPSTSLKFVKNTTGRRGKKHAANASNGGKSALNMIEEVKQQHRKDLAKAAEIYARKLHHLKKDVNKYRKEAEALRASAIGDRPQDCDNAGINTKTGVAQNDKENISGKREMIKRTQLSRLKQHEGDPIQHKSEINPIFQRSLATIVDTKKANQNERTTKVKDENELDDLIDPYERFFLEDYRFEKDPKCEEALRKCTMLKVLRREKNRALCQDLIAFMEDVRANRIGSPIKGAE
jgi:hypothetical protein